MLFTIITIKEGEKSQYSQNIGVGTLLLRGLICSTSLGKIATYTYPGPIVERSMQGRERMPFCLKKYGGLVLAFGKSITGDVSTSTEKKNTAQLTP